MSNIFRRRIYDEQRKLSEKYCHDFSVLHVRRLGVNLTIVKRFSDELIEILEELKWWDKSVEEINDLIPLLTSSNLKYVKEELKKISQ